MKAKKFLGQHFLKSRMALKLIVAAAKLKEDDTVFEIGPGRGILTEALIEMANKIVAVEKDSELVKYLSDKFSKEIQLGKLRLVEEDVMRIADKFIEEMGPYKIVANIPYYITGGIIKKFLSHTNQPNLMVLIVQKEVAKRIVAKDKKESLLSISVKSYGQPSYIATIPARYFSPAPKVDSAIIAISAISKGFFQNIKEEGFFLIVKSGFAHKRKRLIRNLEGIADKKNLEAIFSSLKISLNIRAEDLSIEDWQKLCQKLT